MKTKLAIFVCGILLSLQSIRAQDSIIAFSISNTCNNGDQLQYQTNSKTFTCAAGSGTGTVTSVSIGSLAPLFTASVANSTTTPAISFLLSSAAANTVFGNNTGSSAAPGF